MYERFEELCKEKGITPYRVAKETGISTATISNWKAGRYTPKADKMLVIAEFFGVSYSYLMGLTPDRNTPKGMIDLTPTIDLIVQNEMDPDNPILIEYETAMDFYERYKHAPAHIQAAIETLLKSPQQEP